MGMLVSRWQGTLTSAVRHPGPVAAGQALDGAGTHQPVPAGAAQLAARPQAAAVGAPPGRVAGGLSAVDVERGTPLGHWGREGRRGGCLALPCLSFPTRT